MHILALILLSLTLTACSILDTLGEATTGLSDYIFGEDNAEPPVELKEIQAEIQVEQLWKESVGDGPGSRLLKLVPGMTDSAIIAGSSEGIIKAFNANNGDEIWEAETELKLSAGPGISERSVVFASSQADVIALNPNSGSVNWKVKVSSEVLSVPVIAKGLVIIRSTDGRIVALDEIDGHKVWSFERGVPALSLRGTGLSVVEDDMLISGFDNGKLLALRLKDGKQIWESSIAMPQGRSEVERLVDLDADPVISDGVIYIASYQGGISAALARTGEVTWRNSTISVYSALYLDRRYIYLSDSTGDVWQLDQGNGASLWKQKELHQRKLTAAVPYESYVVVGDFEGYVHWLSVHDGRQLGRYQVTSDAIVAPPVVKDDIIYVYAKDGSLAALKAR